MSILKKKLQDKLYYERMAKDIPGLLEDGEKLLFGDSTIARGEVIGAEKDTFGYGYYLAITDRRILLKRVKFPSASACIDELSLGYNELLRISQRGYTAVIVLKDGRILKLSCLDKSEVYAANVVRLINAYMPEA